MLPPLLCGVQIPHDTFDVTALCRRDNASVIIRSDFHFRIHPFRKTINQFNVISCQRRTFIVTERLYKSRCSYPQLAVRRFRLRNVRHRLIRGLHPPVIHIVQRSVSLQFRQKLIYFFRKLRNFCFGRNTDCNIYAFSNIFIEQLYPRQTVCNRKFHHYAVIDKRIQFPLFNRHISRYTIGKSLVCRFRKILFHQVHARRALSDANRILRVI